MKYCLLAGLALFLAGCAGADAPGEPELAAAEPSAQDLAADGAAIAVERCASCHAVGASGESPVVGAPVFRELMSRYRADVLEEELIAGIQVAHPMPEFHFNPQDADALVAYLGTIQTPDSSD